MPGRIEDYALIGDCETAALVHLGGCIDWLCWPRFDSPACFAALLGEQHNGSWSLAPAQQPRRISRAYRGETLILETRFETEGGVAVVRDFMPVRESHSKLVRIVVVASGVVRFKSILRPRFEYGSREPRWTSATATRARAAVGPDGVILTSSTQLTCREDGCCTAEFDARPGTAVTFVLDYFESFGQEPQATDPHAALAETERFWAGWVRQCTYRGPWREAVIRSLITMKALTYRPSGGIVAAATSSLPEWPGGSRNWDYRFCWLRDATFTLLAFMHSGYREEAVAWSNWLCRALGSEPRGLQPIYGMRGESRLPEWQAHWLRGFDESRPVRFGNNAFTQHQLDVYGELVDALHQARSLGIGLNESLWRLQVRLIEHLSTIWREPDHGIWESRHRPKCFTQSQAMAWAALDRTIRSAELDRRAGSLQRWQQLRSEIHARVCQHGFNRSRNAFVRDFDSSELDASLLLLPQIGFLPAHDPRILGTIEVIGRELLRDGLVFRYDTEVTNDGLDSGEAGFIACTFWYIDALCLTGRRPQAVELFEHVLSLRNDVGLLSEEYDGSGGRMTGNFPQTLSHLALVNSALNLDSENGPARARAAIG